MERVTAFMDERVYPAEAVYEEQMRESGDPHFHPPVIEELKAEARARGLWNLFHPHPEWGPGLTQRRVRAAGRDHGALAAPGAGGDELQRPRHRQHGGADAVRHRGAQGAVAAPAARRRDPLGVRDDRAGASPPATPPTSRRGSSATATSTCINGRKWWTSNALHRNCKVLIVMGKTDPDGPPHRQQSMMVVPIDAPGVTIVRGLPVFGYQDREGHAEVALRGRAGAGERAAGRRGRRLHDHPGAARARAHPPLHALDRHGRAGARPALPAGAGSG